LGGHERRLLQVAGPRDEPVCLRTAYRAAYKIKDGTDEVLQVRSHAIMGGDGELIVRGLPRTARLNGKLGVRYRQLVPSVSTRG